MGGDTPPLPHMLSWCAEEQLYLYHLSHLRNVYERSPTDGELRLRDSPFMPTAVLPSSPCGTSTSPKRLSLLMAITVTITNSRMDAMARQLEGNLGKNAEKGKRNR